MSATVADPNAELATLAYDVYVEGLAQLRALRASLDAIEAVEHAALSAGGLEAEALSYALCDYLAGAPVRGREDFCRVVTGSR
jgi:hypothetical protein